MKRWFRALGTACLLGATVQPALAEVGEIRITKQPSIIYLPLVVMEQNKLVEKHARAAGLGEVKMTWVTLTSGGAATDALLSGSVDLVTSGVSNLLLLWDRTNGQVMGVTSVGGLPMLLVTRDPDVKTLKDFTPKDKIAVPTIKVSSQAIVLKMAMEKLYGEASRDKLDPMTVQLGHPDAMTAVVGGASEVNSHFSAPPYQATELKAPGVHLVLDSSTVFGGPASNAVVFGTRKFCDANPKTIAAFLAFFPVAVGALRGLTSPPPAALELLASYAAPWSATLFKLRLPAAVPYLMPALRLAANAAVIGTIVAEISTGLKGGIGRLILEYMREATADPAKVFTAVMGAAVLGLVMAGLVGLLDGFVSRHRPRELTT